MQGGGGASRGLQHPRGFTSPGSVFLPSGRCSSRRVAAGAPGSFVPLPKRPGWGNTGVGGGGCWRGSYGAGGAGPAGLCFGAGEHPSTGRRSSILEWHHRNVPTSAWLLPLRSIPVSPPLWHWGNIRTRLGLARGEHPLRFCSRGANPSVLLLPHGPFPPQLRFCLGRTTRPWFCFWTREPSSSRLQSCPTGHLHLGSTPAPREQPPPQQRPRSAAAPTCTDLSMSSTGRFFARIAWGCQRERGKKKDEKMWGELVPPHAPSRAEPGCVGRSEWLERWRRNLSRLVSCKANGKFCLPLGLRQAPEAAEPSPPSSLLPFRPSCQKTVPCGAESCLQPPPSTRFAAPLRRAGRRNPVARFVLHENE